MLRLEGSYDLFRSTPYPHQICPERPLEPLQPAAVHCDRLVRQSVVYEDSECKENVNSSRAYNPNAVVRCVCVDQDGRRSCDDLIAHLDHGKANLSDSAHPTGCMALLACACERSRLEVERGGHPGQQQQAAAYLGENLAQQPRI